MKHYVMVFNKFLMHHCNYRVIKTSLPYSRLIFLLTTTDGKKNTEFLTLMPHHYSSSSSHGKNSAKTFFRLPKTYQSPQS